MTKEIVKEKELYEGLVEELASTITEGVFNARDTIIRMKWIVGQTILGFKTDNLTKLLTDLSVDLKVSERELWRCIAFVRHFKDYKKVEQLEEQKNLSWNKILTKYLQSGEQINKKEKEFTCPKCHFAGVISKFYGK